jgi:hypothetical protein
MSTLVTTQFLLLRLPRELRDRIFSRSFLEIEVFSESWSTIDTSEKNALFQEPRGLCQANRQRFREATPVLLAHNMASWNTLTSTELINLYSRFPDDAMTKGIR